mmetsp:Transcript_12464/g.18457  ORF Transcript_12464/g.18457 Transcript_12464/m.18457 type:complete len:89 (-) Transcript_12464:695-961(-)
MFCILFAINKWAHAIIKKAVRFGEVEDVELNSDARPDVGTLEVEPLCVPDRMDIMMQIKIVLLDRLVPVPYITKHQSACIQKIATLKV